MQASTESDEQPLTAERVVREHAPRVYNLARRMLGNESDAEDVTQDVMLQVVRKLDTFRGEAALSTWLHRVTVNAALAHRRKRANHHEQMTEPLDDFSQDGRRNGPVRRWAVPRSNRRWTARSVPDRKGHRPPARSVPRCLRLGRCARTS
jgi:RNA polymerase sigma factor (sigma-70 family)